MDFDATDQLLIIYFAFVKYLRKNGNTIRQCISYLQTSRKLRKEVFYDSLTEFGIPVKLVTLIKLCLNETCSRVWVAKHLPDIFPTKNGLKQGEAL